MTLPAEIARLVETFERNRESYAQGRYSETQLRREYIDPLFKALGWDVDNTRGWAEAYKDVIHEDAIRIGSTVKAPDYCFRIGGTRKFFIEAKAPTVNLKDDPEPAYQLRRYAWSAKLPLSILTDFEEFAVYDCRVRPHQADKPSKARTKYWRYTDYLDRWDEIASIFSYDAVLKGSFDKYATSEKRLHGTAEVDAAFLAEIETWRDNLAHNIALRNPGVANRHLNYAVQITIDRLIFLRICEDRGIERYGQLMGLLNGPEVYPRLMAVFRQADDRYNSGLFHFMPEKDRHEGPDELTPDLVIDDKPLKDILRSLYYPESPYEFSVLPAEILGQVYEQFLGKVITLTAGHHARVEDKPEVKKAGGVFYTPAYIVDYIVKQTVGKLLEGRSVTFYKTKAPKLDRPLRVLDPACGSGSFLLGAYQQLLDWYRDYYEQNDPEKWAAAKVPPIYPAGPAGWRLTLAERKRILLDHIFGVDIDTQAVEVTKLSLLLRVLEGEKNLVLFHNERALPDLAANIKCGNSLISPDFYKDQQLAMFEEQERLRINAFDWHVEFPEVFKDGGFDAVIGNPPYVRMEQFKEVKDYLRAHFQAHEERADFYAYFVEQGIKLLSSNALYGMIVSNKFTVAKYGRPLRRLLATQASIRSVTDFAGQRVFHGATVRTIVLIATRCHREPIPGSVYVPVPSLETFKQIEGGSLPVSDYARQAAVNIAERQIGESPWQLASEHAARLIDRLEKTHTSLRDAGLKPLFGIKTGLNDAFLISDSIRSRILASQKSARDVIKPILLGRDIRRYAVQNARRYVIYLHPDRDIAAYSAIAEYLAPYRARLEQRATQQRWYELQQPGVALLPCLARPKIVYPIIAPEPRFSLDHEGFLINDKAFVLPSDSLYLLGCLNSRLGNFYFRSVCARLEGSNECYFEFRAQFVERFPVPPESKVDPRQHDLLLRWVRTIQQLHENLPRAKTPTEKTALERQIAATDAQIDALVYELYGLTDEEIQIVEEATR